MFTLAEKLGKTVEEVGRIGQAEFNGWLAYYQIKAAQNGDS